MINIENISNEFKEFHSDSVSQTEKFAENLALNCKGGEIFLLSGDLGAGKTVFAKGFAKGLGIDDSITSPTFALHNSYEGRLILNHFDFYRITDDDEARMLGLDEFFGEKGSVCLIEWWVNVQSLLPCGVTEISITPLSETMRLIRLYPKRQAVRNK